MIETIVGWVLLWIPCIVSTQLPSPPSCCPLGAQTHPYEPASLACVLSLQAPRVLFYWVVQPKVWASSPVGEALQSLLAALGSIKVDWAPKCGETMLAQSHVLLETLLWLLAASAHSSSKHVGGSGDGTLMLPSVMVEVITFKLQGKSDANIHGCNTACILTRAD